MSLLKKYYIYFKESTNFMLTHFVSEKNYIFPQKIPLWNWMDDLGPLPTLKFFTILNSLWKNSHFATFTRLQGDFFTGTPPKSFKYRKVNLG